MGTNPNEMVWYRKMKCVMCKNEFEVKDLDFLERCEQCFKIWMTTPEDERVKLGVPYTPIYNGKAKYGF
jgi:hypothetical protein